jgi:hypothetical protein
MVAKVVEQYITYFWEYSLLVKESFNLVVAPIHRSAGKFPYLGRFREYLNTTDAWKEQQLCITFSVKGKRRSTNAMVVRSHRSALQIFSVDFWYRYDECCMWVFSIDGALFKTGTTSVIAVLLLFLNVAILKLYMPWH